MPTLIDETGNVYGQLTVIQQTENIGRNPAWVCKCSCGKQEIIRGQDLRDGIRHMCRDCGRKLRKPGITRKNGKESDEYIVYNSMLTRNKNHERYKNIPIDERWLGKDGFVHFLEDMGPRPNKTYTLDRINGDLGYGPDNCRWATPHEQAINRRTTVFMEMHRECVALIEFCKLHGLNHSTVTEQLKRGWVLEQIVGEQVENYTPRDDEILPDKTVVDVGRVGESVTVGQRFDALEVIAVLRPLSCGHARVLCRCTACGRQIAVHVRQLLTGYILNCGCMHYHTPNKGQHYRDTLREKYGSNFEQLYTKAYTAWRNMIYKKTNTIDQNWLGKYGFVNFIKDVGLPASTDVLMRIDQTGVYTAVNVRWQNRGTLVQGFLWSREATADDITAVAVAEKGQHAHNFIDLTGQVFGKLTVLYRSNVKHTSSSNVMWHCKCTCGNEVDVLGMHLTKGATKSCGCLRSEKIKVENPVHERPGYGSWSAMINRCYNSKNNRYSIYGGKGITVCSQWRGKGGFEQFIADLGEPPSKEHSIDRIDNTGNYEPGNCRWATAKQQANNKTNSHFLTISTGETHTLAEWETLKGLTRGIVYDRLQHGHTPDEAISTERLNAAKPKQCKLVVKRHRYADFTTTLAMDDGVNKYVIGQQYGNLMPVNRVNVARGKFRWLCRCTCGNMVLVDISKVLNGKIQSCGCTRGEHVMVDNFNDIDLTPTTEDCNAFAIIQNRGDVWPTSINEMILAVGHCPVNGIPVLIHDDQPACEANFRWAITGVYKKATPCDTQTLTLNGQTHTVNEWCALLGLKKITVYKRLARGCSPSEALSTKRLNIKKE